MEGTADILLLSEMIPGSRGLLHAPVGGMVLVAMAAPGIEERGFGAKHDTRRAIAHARAHHTHVPEPGQCHGPAPWSTWHVQYRTARRVCVRILVLVSYARAPSLASRDADRRRSTTRRSPALDDAPLAGGHVAALIARAG